MITVHLHYIILEIYESKKESHREKQFLDKKPGIKNFGKNSQFSEILGQNVTGNKVLSFRFLGLFSQNNMGAANKVSGNKITGIKVLMKKVRSLVNMRSSLRRFYKKDFFSENLHIEYSQECFFINFPFFCMVVNILCSHAFSTKTFFRGHFCK